MDISPIASESVTEFLTKQSSRIWSNPLYHENCASIELSETADFPITHFYQLPRRLERFISRTGTSRCTTVNKRKFCWYSGNKKIRCIIYAKNTDSHFIYRADGISIIRVWILNIEMQEI